MPEHNMRILVVDGDPVAAEALAEVLTERNYDVLTAHDPLEATNLIQQATDSPIAGAIGIAIVDAHVPRIGGVELVKQLRKKYPDVVSVMISGFGHLQTAVDAIRLGAADFLVKPVVDEELFTAVERAAQQHTLLAENSSLKAQLTERYGLGSLVGSDYRMQRVYDLVDAVADSKTTVLITGESGTGKSMVAKAIHAASPRASHPFVTFSCGSIPETLLESELFGHVKGAFTGADHDKPGKVLAAEAGSLFIDEINSATMPLQIKLLRVLQEKAFEPVGSATTREVDVRFVLATNQDLTNMVQDGLFREDLYYRINVVNIHLPPLRERTGDIPLLADHFLGKYCEEMDRTRKISNTAVDALRAYDWPGNVRELENAIERAVLLSRTPTIEPTDLPDPILDMFQGVIPTGPRLRLAGGSENDGLGEMIPALANGWTPMPLDEAMKAPERQILQAALDANDWNRQKTAAQLDINRTTLYKKIKQFQLDQPA